MWSSISLLEFLFHCRRQGSCDVQGVPSNTSVTGKPFNAFALPVTSLVSLVYVKYVIRNEQTPLGRPSTISRNTRSRLFYPTVIFHNSTCGPRHDIKFLMPLTCPSSNIRIALVDVLSADYTLPSDGMGLRLSKYTGQSVISSYLHIMLGRLMIFRPVPHGAKGSRLNVR